ncbi:MAG: hypothetical protein V3571_00065, partial [Pseudodesulfovibrio sp.]
NDEHLLHNIARCYWEKGNVKGCKEYLRRSLQINPELKESKQFWEFLKSKGHIGGDEEGA